MYTIHKLNKRTQREATPWQHLKEHYGPEHWLQDWHKLTGAAYSGPELMPCKHSITFTRVYSMRYLDFDNLTFGLPNGETTYQCENEYIGYAPHQDRDNSDDTIDDTEGQDNGH